MNQKTMIVQFLIIALITQKAVTEDKVFIWPDNARAAVCLTYDDGTESQLEIATTHLNQAGFKGTFYLQGDNITKDNLFQWRQQSEMGHELGNHSCFHPCSQSFDWIWPEFATEKYTIRRMLKELAVMNTLLFSIDGKEERTYAYPCAELIVGGDLYIDSLRNSNLFIAARGGEDPGELKDMKDLDIFNVPSWAVNEHSGEEMIAEVEKAVEQGAMLIIMFHGVGGDYLKVSAEAHEELLSYLSDHKDVVWTAPFLEVMKYIIAERQ